MKQYIKLFANCIPVKGYKQSFIYDLQRPKTSNAIPNDLFEILTEHSDKRLEEIKEYYAHQFDNAIDEYFSFLIEEGFAYCFDERELLFFPSLENIWKTSSIITNAIIYISKKNFIYLQNIFQELSVLRCDALQLCFLELPSGEQIKKICDSLEQLRILSIELMINCRNKDYILSLITIFNQYPRFQRLYIGNFPENLSSDDGRIVTDINNIDFQNACGKISPFYFSLNMNIFFEALNFNTCLNRKLCIDAEGNIKNCPVMQQNYGNISTMTLKEVVEKPEFKKLWHISKDQIDVCKDCEFRYMCTDCRCFIKDPENIYSQPAKCTYNPYIGKWEGQEGYVVVEECGTYCKETGFVPNHKKIKELNQQILDKEQL
jgi:SPASM domain peptide maturase of grasp-with-spasm system